MTPTPPGPDPRRNAWRGDLAAEALRGIVAVPRYVAGTTYQVRAATASVRRQPHADAVLDTEALHGARVTVFELSDGWAWVQLVRDGYVGYVRREDLSSDIVDATHRVSALGAHVYPRPDIKAPAIERLGLNAEVAVVQIDGRFARLAGGGFVVTQHLAVCNERAADFVTVAEHLIGSPYLWGGRTPLGIDCSGLVQIALEAAGFAAPRDSDMQAAEVGAPLAVAGSYQGLRRGDLVCWPGHIGIMRDAGTLLHANAHHMAVASEPLADAMARIGADGTKPTGFRRLPRLSA